MKVTEATIKLTIKSKKDTGIATIEKVAPGVMLVSFQFADQRGEGSSRPSKKQVQDTLNTMEVAYIKSTAKWNK